MADSYSTAVLVDAPTAYWRLNDTGATALDSSGNSNSLSLGASVTKSSTGLLNQTVSTDHSMVFPFLDGAAYSASSVARIPTLEGTTCSVEVWIKLGTIHPNTVQSIYSYGSSISLYSYTSGTTTYEIAMDLDVGGQLETISSNTLTTGTIYHVVFTYDGSTARIYINGIANGTFSQVASIVGFVGNVGPAIGQSWSGTNLLDPFDGTIDEVAIYANKVLTPTRILAHYNAGITASGTTYLKTLSVSQNSSVALTKSVIPLSGITSSDAVIGYSATAPLTLTWPLGAPPDGDILLAWVTGASNTGAVVPPVGWITLQNSANPGNDSTTNYCRAAFFWKVASGESSTSRWDAATTGNPLEVSLLRVSGAARSTPQWTANFNTSAPAVTPSLIAPNIGSLIITAFTGQTTITSFSTPANCTQRTLLHQAGQAFCLATFTDNTLTTNTTTSHSYTSTITGTYGSVNEFIVILAPSVIVIPGNITQIGSSQVSGNSNIVSFTGLSATVNDVQLITILSGATTGETHQVSVLPPGCVLIDDRIDTTGAVGGWIGTYLISSSLVTNPSFTLASSHSWVGLATEFSGCTGIDVHSINSQPNATAGTLNTSLAITPTKSNDMLLSLFGLRSNNNTVTAPPSGYTEVVLGGIAGVTYYSLRSYMLSNPILTPQQPGLVWGNGTTSTMFGTYVTLVASGQTYTKSIQVTQSSIVSISKILGFTKILASASNISVNRNYKLGRSLSSSNTAISSNISTKLISLSSSSTNSLFRSNTVKRSYTISQNSSSIYVKNLKRQITVIQLNNPLITRSFNNRASYISSNVSSLTRTLLLKLSISSTSTSSLNKLLSSRFIVSTSSNSILSTSINRAKILTLSNLSVSSLTKQRAITLLVSSTSTIYRTTSYAKNIPLTTTSNVSIIRKISSAKTVVSPSNISTTKVIGKQYSLLGTNSSTFSKQNVHSINLANSSATSLSKTITKTQILSTISLLSITKAIPRLITLSSSSSILLTHFPGKVSSISSNSIPSIARYLHIYKTLSVLSSSISNIGLLTNRTKTLYVYNISNASIAKIKSSIPLVTSISTSYRSYSIGKILPYNSLSNTNLIRKLAKMISISSNSNALYSTGQVLSKVLSIASASNQLFTYVTKDSRVIGISQSSNISITRSITRSVSVVSSNTSNLSINRLGKFSVLSSSSSLISKKINRILSISNTSSITVKIPILLLKTFTSSNTSTINLQRTYGINRSVNESSTAIISRGSIAFKSISLSQLSSPVLGLGKALSKNLSVTSISNISTIYIYHDQHITQLSQNSIASISRNLTKTYTVTSTNLSKINKTYTPSYSVIQVSGISIRRNITKSLSVMQASISMVRSGYYYTKSLGTSSNSITSSLESSIDRRSIALTSLSIPSITRSINPVIKVLTNPISQVSKNLTPYINYLVISSQVSSLGKNISKSYTLIGSNTSIVTQLRKAYRLLSISQISSINIGMIAGDNRIYSNQQLSTSILQRQMFKIIPINHFPLLTYSTINIAINLSKHINIVNSSVCNVTKTLYNKLVVTSTNVASRSNSISHIVNLTSSSTSMMFTNHNRIGSVSSNSFITINRNLGKDSIVSNTSMITLGAAYKTTYSKASYSTQSITRGIASINTVTSVSLSTLTRNFTGYYSVKNTSKTYLISNRTMTLGISSTSSISITPSLFRTINLLLSSSSHCSVSYEAPINVFVTYKSFYKSTLNLVSSSPSFKPVRVINGNVPLAVTYQAYIDNDLAKALTPVLGRFPEARSNSIRSTIHLVQNSIGTLQDFEIIISSNIYPRLLAMYETYLLSNGADFVHLPMYYGDKQIDLILDNIFLTRLFAQVKYEMMGYSSSNWQSNITLAYPYGIDSQGEWGMADNSPINPGYDG